MTGTWITDKQATDPGYWAMHMCLPVRFAQCVGEHFKVSDNILVEVGPGQALSAWAMQQADSAGSDRVILPSMRHSYDKQPDLALMLSTLAKLWLAGARVDWTGFYTRERRHRVPLPTYPFERKRHWIDPQSQEKSNHRASLTKREDVADWFYLPAWKQSRLLVAGELSGRDNWLAFMDDCGVGSQLVERLKGAGQNVVAVKAGERFSKVDEGAYTINPSSPDDYFSLLNDLRSLGAVPSTIVHLWCVGSDSRTGPRIESAEKWQQRGFLASFTLLKPGAI